MDKLSQNMVTPLKSVHIQFAGLLETICVCVYICLVTNIYQLISTAAQINAQMRNQTEAIPINQTSTTNAKKYAMWGLLGITGSICNLTVVMFSTIDSYPGDERTLLSRDGANTAGLGAGSCSATSQIVHQFVACIESPV